MQSVRADLFRLLGDEDRLRLLALCAEEELTVGELAQLLGESQPQITKKTQPLREAAVLGAQPAAFGDAGREHQVVVRELGPEQRARPIAARGEQAGLAKV